MLICCCIFRSLGSTRATLFLLCWFCVNDTIHGASHLTPVILLMHELFAFNAVDIIIIIIIWGLDLKGHWWKYSQKQSGIMIRKLVDVLNYIEELMFHLIYFSSLDRCEVNIFTSLHFNDQNIVWININSSPAWNCMQYGVCHPVTYACQVSTKCKTRF